ncbi:MAG: Mut7-C ubiquitin/RNAse domain-containing protein [Caldilineaceae bacterium]|nr:Mut7-C ubiquitin/RNAse domain-containing protein [Caldilineaceae bacterium]
MPIATFRFYADLNDFLAPGLRQIDFPHSFNGEASVKDRIESLGVPHPEVGAIVVNGQPVTFLYLIQNGDRVAVYPEFHCLSSDFAVVREPYTGEKRFILDVHLGKLANYLRMLGFDTLYRNDYADEQLARIAAEDGRILLTRDLGLLKRREVIYGYYVRSLDPNQQVAEVLRRFDLIDAIEPFHRCLACNGLLTAVAKEEIFDRLLPKTRRYYDEFYCCRVCAQIYWKGSHFEQMQRFIEDLHKRTPPLRTADE